MQEVMTGSNGNQTRFQTHILSSGIGNDTIEVTGD